jgi:hypothetical protein
MKIEVNLEELEFLMRFCKRSIKIAAQLKNKTGTIFDTERGENIEKATKLYKKLEMAYQIWEITNDMGNYK